MAFDEAAARARILEQLEAYRQAWLASDIAQFKALWDANHPNLTFMPMERFRVLRDWPSIVAYWERILPLTVMERWEVRNPRIDFLGERHAFVFAEDSFSYQVADGSQVGSQAYEARTSFVFKETDGDWKLIHYEDSIQWFPSSDDARRKDA
jgi:hypothetical protein